MFTIQDAKIFFTGNTCFNHRLDPFVKIVPDFQTYKTKLIIVKPSSYGDNLDIDTVFAVLT